MVSKQWWEYTVYLVLEKSHVPSPLNTCSNNFCLLAVLLSQ